MNHYTKKDNKMVPVSMLALRFNVYKFTKIDRLKMKIKDFNSR